MARVGRKSFLAMPPRGGRGRQLLLGLYHVGTPPQQVGRYARSYDAPVVGQPRVAAQQRLQLRGIAAREQPQRVDRRAYRGVQRRYRRPRGVEYAPRLVHIDFRRQAALKARVGQPRDGVLPRYVRLGHRELGLPYAQLDVGRRYLGGHTHLGAHPLGPRGPVGVLLQIDIGTHAPEYVQLPRRGRLGRPGADGHPVGTCAVIAAAEAHGGEVSRPGHLDLPARRLHAVHSHAYLVVGILPQRDQRVQHRVVKLPPPGIVGRQGLLHRLGIEPPLGQLARQGLLRRRRHGEYRRDGSRCDK